MRGVASVLLLVAACGGVSPPPPAPVTSVCTEPAETGGAAQQRALVGAYYFDGWTGPLTNFHFDGLVNGPFADREPLTGWLDKDARVVEQQLATARGFGIDFFVFDWYFGAPQTSGGEDVNSALNRTRALTDRHSMRYAILYVNAPPFVASYEQWPGVVDSWLSYFEDPAYLRIDGRPVLFVIDSQGLRTTFGDSTATALADLDAAARARGFPGVFLVAGVGYPRQGDVTEFQRRVALPFAADGYRAISTYNYPNTPDPVDIMLPFSALAGAARWIWSESERYSPLPVIPVAMAGWDSRPWNQLQSVWYTRTPEEVAALVGEAADWAEATPRLRVPASPAPPMVLIEAWNEIGEGGYLIPTVGEGCSYGAALAGELLKGSSRTRTVLTVAEAGPTVSPREASGQLTTAAGEPLEGAAVALFARPATLDSPGIVAPYLIADTVPADAAQAVVGFRINYEMFLGSTTAGASSVFLYSASFRQDGGSELVADPAFTSASSWVLADEAQLVASDRGSGQMVSVQVTAAQIAGLGSMPFTVTPGASFEARFEARVVPTSAPSGYFTVIFLKGGGGEAGRLAIPVTPIPPAPVGSGLTDGAGAYRCVLEYLGTEPLRLEASYAGTSTLWPAWAVTP